jgi:hypothetical protein
MMLKTEYLRHHIDALLRLSRDVKDPAVSAKLLEMADEFRMIVSVADIMGLAADLNRNDITFVPSALPSKPADVVPFKSPGRLSARHRIGDHFHSNHHLAAFLRS